jgi:hypothetical protein
MEGKFWSFSIRFPPQVYFILLFVKFTSTYKIFTKMTSESSLEIINQESINHDNEGTTLVHYIVKNHPFVLVVGSSWNLLRCKIVCRLLYDFEEESERKEVTFIKQNPLEYKGWYKLFARLM